jgi:hypothetical protein
LQDSALFGINLKLVKASFTLAIFKKLASQKRLASQPIWGLLAFLQIVHLNGQF